MFSQEGNSFQKFLRPLFCKIRQKFGHKFFQPTFFSPAPFWAFWPESRPPGNTSCCPATHPLLPLPPFLLTPPTPSSPPTNCSISQILKDDYRLPFCEIIFYGNFRFDSRNKNLVLLTLNKFKAELTTQMRTVAAIPHTTLVLLSSILQFSIFFSTIFSNENGRYIAIIPYGLRTYRLFLMF